MYFLSLVGFSSSPDGCFGFVSLRLSECESQANEASELNCFGFQCSHTTGGYVGACVCMQLS